jgi:predicted nucleic acid-binding protein
MSLESGLIDANVLVYASTRRAPQHSAALQLVQSALDGATTLYVTSQILCEFYSIVTNRRRVEKPLSALEALSLVATNAEIFHILPTPRQSVEILLDLLRRRPVTGSDIFDLQIVAAMKANGIRRIYTFNVADFQPFSELEVIVP